MKRAVLALDQGTTGTAALVFDADGSVLGAADREIRQSYPQPGWVEHDPHEILSTTIAVAGEAMSRAGIGARDVAAIGITNQRETAVVWDRSTGEPIYPAVVWQSRASAQICERLKADGLEPMFRAHGLRSMLFRRRCWLLDRPAESARPALPSVPRLPAHWRLLAAHRQDSKCLCAPAFNIETLEWDITLDARVPRAMRRRCADR